MSAERRMRAAGVRSFGSAVVALELPAPPDPGPDEVLIRVRAAGVGNWDAIVRDGNWDVGRPPPLALGVEAAGTVEAAGDEAGGLAPGDGVLTHPLPLRHQGAWAELLLAPAALVARKPDALGWEAAGGLPVPGLTAWRLVREVLEVQPGQRVLVHGAGGATGGLAVGLAALAGAEVLATASAAGAERLRRLGASATFDREDPEWPEAVREATGGAGVDGAVNGARGGAADALRAVRDGGRLATITQDAPPQERGVAISDVYVAPDAAALAEVAELVAGGRLELAVAATWPLDQAAQALEAAVAGAGGGVVALSTG